MVYIDYGGEINQVAMDKEATVYDLKIIIEQILGIKIKDQTLIHNEIELRDDDKIIRCQMSEGAIVISQVKSYRTLYNGMNFTLMSSDRATVASLKQRVAENFDIPIDTQLVCINYDMKEMEDENILQAYHTNGIYPIYVVQKFRIRIQGIYSYDRMVNEAMTIWNICRKLAEMYGLDRSKLKIRLEENSEFLDETLSLKDCGIGHFEDGTIYLHGDQVN